MSLFSQSHRLIHFIVYLFLFPLIFIGVTCANASPDNDKFFSYKRLILNQNIGQNLPRGTEVKRELDVFFTSYNKGLDAANGGDLKNAKMYFQEARKSWPEYFGTDFLIALVYEKEADYKKAARYYKSYLNKLKAFYAGRYRISNSLIQSVTVEKVESYDEAYQLIKERLSVYNIDPKKVMPIFTFPIFILPSVIVISLLSAYLLLFQWLIPQFRRQHMIKHPPQGFWTCAKCLHTNPLLRNECEECGQIK